MGEERERGTRVCIYKRESGRERVRVGDGRECERELGMEERESREGDKELEREIIGSGRGGMGVCVRDLESRG